MSSGTFIYCSSSTNVPEEPAAFVRVDAEDKGSMLHHHVGTYHHNAKRCISLECTFILINLRILNNKLTAELCYPCEGQAKKWSIVFLILDSTC